MHDKLDRYNLKNLVQTTIALYQGKIFIFHQILVSSNSCCLYSLGFQIGDLLDITICHPLVRNNEVGGGDVGGRRNGGGRPQQIVRLH